jgi:hypothetical protein
MPKIPLNSTVICMSPGAFAKTPTAFTQAPDLWYEHRTNGCVAIGVNLDVEFEQGAMVIPPEHIKQVISWLQKVARTNDTWDRINKNEDCIPTGTPYE